MRYLLDTHIWLWSLLTPDKLNSNVEEVLRNDDNEFYISPITI
jgi:PIN domain nuclease of toxin-antitoxin system